VVRTTDCGHHNWPDGVYLRGHFTRYLPQHFEMVTAEPCSQGTPSNQMELWAAPAEGA
jgi:hypothetical protein